MILETIIFMVALCISGMFLFNVINTYVQKTQTSAFMFIILVLAWGLFYYVSSIPL